MEQICKYADTFQQPPTCKVTLQNKELWKQFHELQTEMIITKSGRRMFPSLRVQITDLDPHAHYCVLLEMTPASVCRYKYSASGGWAPAGSEEAHSPHRIYVHPESPATGEHWMSQPVSFGRLKLTNTPTAPAGHVVLSSMHKYQPRVIIAKTLHPSAVAWSPSVAVAFPETQFIAVTAYQNDKITKLKIDNNPFAKGFRENGQSDKSKRKRTSSGGHEKEETEAKKSRYELPSPKPEEHHDDSESTTSSSPDVSRQPDAAMQMYTCTPAVPMFNRQFQHLPYRYHGAIPSFGGSYYYPHPQHHGNGSNMRWYWYPPSEQYYHHQIPYYPASFYSAAVDRSTSKPKRLTDFSIKAITGIS